MEQKKKTRKWMKTTIFTLIKAQKIILKAVLFCRQHGISIS